VFEVIWQWSFSSWQNDKCHTCNRRHIWRKQSETELRQVTLDIFGQIKLDT